MLPMRAYHFLNLCPFLVSVALFAQQPPTPTPPPVPAAPDQLTISVIVKNKSGVPVAGLPQNEFTLLDGKQPQPIIGFRAVGGNNSTDEGSEVVLVVDAVNTSFSRVAFERSQLDKFLKTDNGKLSRPVSIDFLTDSGLNIQNTSTRDGNSLATYLDQHATSLRYLNRSQGFYGAADRAMLSLRALGQLAEFEQGRPGRKFVIWISPGWPLLTGPRIQLTNKQEDSIFQTVVGTSMLLAQARITLYSVDPLGMEDAATFRTSYYEQFLKPLTAPKQAQFGNLGLQVFAIHSGGRVLTSSNDIAKEIANCARDADAFYMLTFRPRPGDGPNDFHPLDVKMAQPELKAETMSGYYAQPGRP